MADLGEKPGRAEVMCAWLYRSGRLIRDIDGAGGDADDSDARRSFRDNSYECTRMGKATRDKLRACATADGGLELEVTHAAPAVVITHRIQFRE